MIIIYHGGGWLVNDKSIMDEPAQYLASHGEYVICNVNYRLLGDQENTVTMLDILGDATGALLWVKDHIAEFGGDPEKISLTGDSAGGHLAESVIVMSDALVNRPDFLPESQTCTPSYMPEGELPEGAFEAQSAVISYGAFNIYQSCKEGNFETAQNIFWMLGQARPRSIFGGEINVVDQPDLYKAVSPIFHVPSSEERQLPPQLFTVGSEDNLTTPELVGAYYEKVKAAGHPAEMWIYEGRPHAFLDSGSNEFLGTSFEKDAPAALDQMLAFWDGVFYGE